MNPPFKEAEIREFYIWVWVKLNHQATCFHLRGQFVLGAVALSCFSSIGVLSRVVSLNIEGGFSLVQSCMIEPVLSIFQKDTFVECMLLAQVGNMHSTVCLLLDTHVSFNRLLDSRRACAEAHVLTDGLAGAETRMIGIVGLHRKSVRERGFPFELLEAGLTVNIEESWIWPPCSFLAARWLPMLPPVSGAILVGYCFRRRCVRATVFCLQRPRLGNSSFQVCKEANTTQPMDKVRILNSIAFPRLETCKLDQPVAPEKHDNFRLVDQALASHFALASWYNCIWLNKRTERLATALRTDVSRKLVQLSFTGCQHFSDPELESLVLNLPSELRVLRLDLGFTGLETLDCFASADLLFLVQLKLRFTGVQD